MRCPMCRGENTRYPGDDDVYYIASCDDCNFEWFTDWADRIAAVVDELNDLRRQIADAPRVESETGYKGTYVIRGEIFTDRLGTFAVVPVSE